MSASAAMVNARRMPEKASDKAAYAQKIAENSSRLLLNQQGSLNSRFGGRCADLP
jgi:hypothetical protein